MEKKTAKSFYGAACLLASFIAWTLLLHFVDVRAIGPRNSVVGFATLNALVRDIVGVNFSLYTITDWLGLVPIITALGFAVLGLIQWIKRKSLWRVESDILALGVFYITVMAVYIFFELFVINRRPVLIDGYLEASYPSSTTVLVLCVMPTAAKQLHSRIQNRTVGRWITLAIFAFVVFMVAGRVLSGVHWITDIIGGILLSLGLVYLYDGVCKSGRFCK